MKKLLQMSIKNLDEDELQDYIDMALLVVIAMEIVILTSAVLDSIATY